MLRASSSKGKLIGVIDFIEASWDRKWNEPGEFMVYMTLDEYMRLSALDMKYIENVERPETGVIQKIEYSREEEGAFVTVSGNFAEALMNFCVYRKNQTIDAESASAVKSAITSYISNANAQISSGSATYRPLGSVTISSDSSFPTTAEASIDSDTQMGEAIYELLSGTGYGVQTKISQYPGVGSAKVIGLSLKIGPGKERTEGDSGVFFGKAYNNVDEVGYTLDESAESCLYEVIQEVEKDYYSKFDSAYFPIKYTGKEEKETKYYIGCVYAYTNNRPTGLGECWPKRVLKTSLSSDECDLTVTTAANQKKIQKLMLKKAKLDMLDHYKMESINVNVLQERYSYMTDYDLGDTCVVLVDDLEQTYHARVEEINETHSDNMINIELVLGSPRRQKGGK